MNFLFPSSIGRLDFFIRFVLTRILFAFLIYKIHGVVGDDLISLVVLLACFAVLLYYEVHFMVIARLHSMGASLWYALAMAPFLIFVFVPPSITFSLLPVIRYYLYLVAFFDFVLLVCPEDAFRQGSVTQAILHEYEVGEGRVLLRIIPLLVTFVFLLGFYDFKFYLGLNDAQSMDNAQLARQIVRGEGFTTEFLRPHALTQLQAYRTSQSLMSGASADLFPPDRFPPGAPRIVPDTYNAPGYPYLLAAWFYVVKPQFVQTHEEMNDRHKYSGDRWIPELNQFFVFGTMLLVFFLGRRLFDDRVAWVATVSFVLSDIVWQYSQTGLSTSVLMFLVTAMLYCATEIFLIDESCVENEENSFTPAWGWTVLLAFLLAATCLTRLHFLVLLIPLAIFLYLLPRSHSMLFPVVAIVAVGMTLPWFWHMYKVCGNPLGSNLPILLYGEDENYQGNQIYCATTLPSYESLFKDSTQKEFLGFLWHLQRGWDLLGANPMILLFVTSILHQFRRPRAQAFRGLVVGCAFFLVAANNLCTDKPEVLSAWNVVVVLFPAMLVIGTSFFFIMVDRLEIHIDLLKTIIVIAAMVLTALPMINSANTSIYNNKFYNFPPYAPPYINLVGRLANPDEWVTTDMPWATAWYADRPSLWLPDSLADFENFHDNVCPSGLLLLTPVTLSQPASNLTAGEYKDWLPFFTGYNIPPHFPLNVHTVTDPGGPDYSIWSDRARWQAQ